MQKKYKISQTIPNITLTLIPSIMKHRIPSITSAMAASASVLLFQSNAAPPSEPIKEEVVTYTYDASGNRIKRVGNMDASIVAGRDSSILIEIYPNPTADILNVTINGLEDGTLPATFSSLDGNRTMHLELEHVNQLDLGAYPRGWYMLNVDTGNQSSQTLKILKR